MERLRDYKVLLGPYFFYGPFQQTQMIKQLAEISLKEPGMLHLNTANTALWEL